ncbi:MAG: ATP-grasp domain-containing protein [Verrucomicrobiae bacterium]|nr:ATP-grasp domain-containing protein [Verrucomicrobiae bacterium]NNJ42875.1 ATP-grasp domain-containing protein [Akkermansiaceae bacterium]
MAPCFTRVPEVMVVESTARLPAFWDQNAAFVANLLGLFFDNKEEAKMLSDTVGEMDSYGGRLLPIVDLLYAGPERNLLVLEREPDPVLKRYFEEVAGLTLPEVAILPHRDYEQIGRQIRDQGVACHGLLEILRDHPAGRMDGYVTDATLAGLAGLVGMRTFSTVAGSQSGNNKWMLYEHLKSQGLPTPHTEIAEGPGDVERCLDSLRRAGYESAVVKAPMGASGIGLIKVPSLRGRGGGDPAVPAHFFTEGPCLIQGWIQAGNLGVKSVRSPSVQLFLNDDQVVIYDVTEQILSDESVHEGNESPPTYLAEHADGRGELFHQAGVAARWLHRRGYRGTASVDFLWVERNDGEFCVYVCELNARVTGATYPCVLAHHYNPDGAWLLRNLRLDTPLLGGELMELLHGSDCLWVPDGHRAGVFPVNFNTGDDGLVHKGQFLFLAPSVSESKLLLETIMMNLPCLTDRD